MRAPPLNSLICHALLSIFLSAGLLLAAFPVQAGSISFGMALVDSKLSLTNQGNSSAFYPVVLRMLADGRWEALQPADKSSRAELPAGAQLDVIWPDMRPLEALTPIEALRPVMVRFFDQAGSGFGQISFFNQPSGASEELAARYVDGAIAITPPATNTIRASWLLWPQEDGVALLAGKVHFNHAQPAARHFTWQPGMREVRIKLGRAQPHAMLLHETAAGFTLQSLPSGIVQGRQQRAYWLNAGERFFQFAGLIAAAGAFALLWFLFGAWHERSTT